MKQLSSPVTAIETNSPIPEIAFKISDENIGRVFKTLANLYVDKLGAIVREILSNAIDACSESGSERPVEIKTPTEEWPYLEIRDFGCGMDDFRVKEIYSSFGASTKRDDNKCIGAHGLGRYSFFSYGEQFTVETVKNGNKLVFSMIRGRGIVLLSCSETDEENGTLVRGQIKEEDFSSIKSKIITFSQLAKRHPILVDGVSLKPATDYAEKVISLGPLSAYKWKSDAPKEVKDCFKKQVYHNVGGVFYPERKDLFTLSGKAAIDKVGIDKTPYDFAILNIEMGDVDIHESRESLDYTEQTVFGLKRLYGQVSDALKVYLEEFAELTKNDTFLEFEKKIAFVPNSQGLIYRSIGTYSIVKHNFDYLFTSKRQKTKKDRSERRNCGHYIGASYLNYPIIKSSQWSEMTKGDKDFIVRKFNKNKNRCFCADDVILFHNDWLYADGNEKTSSLIIDFLKNNHGVPIFEFSAEAIKQERKDIARENARLAREARKAAGYAKPVYGKKGVTVYLDEELDDSYEPEDGDVIDYVEVSSFNDPDENQQTAFYAAKLGFAGRSKGIPCFVRPSAAKYLQKHYNAKPIVIDKDLIAAKVAKSMSHEFFIHLADFQSYDKLKASFTKLAQEHKSILGPNGVLFLEYVSKKKVSDDAKSLFRLLRGKLLEVTFFDPSIHSIVRKFWQHWAHDMYCGSAHQNEFIRTTVEKAYENAVLQEFGREIEKYTNQKGWAVPYIINNQEVADNQLAAKTA